MFDTIFLTLISIGYASAALGLGANLIFNRPKLAGSFYTVGIACAAALVATHLYYGAN